MENISTREFNQIYKANYGKLLQYVITKVKNLEDSEEIVNTVFTKVYNKYHLFDSSKSSLNTWISNICNNTMIDYFRANSNKSEMFVNVSRFADNETGREVFQFIDSDDTETVLVGKILSTKIDIAINNLPEKYKVLADLFFIQDLPYAKIAEILDIPLGSVKGMISRTRDILQSSLADCHNKRVHQLA